jgi:hypothetical protein
MYRISFLVIETESPEEERRRVPEVEPTTKGISQELPACIVWNIGGYLFSTFLSEEADYP